MFNWKEKYWRICSVFLQVVCPMELWWIGLSVKACVLRSHCTYRLSHMSSLTSHSSHTHSVISVSGLRFKKIKHLLFKCFYLTNFWIQVGAIHLLRYYGTVAVVIPANSTKPCRTFNILNYTRLIVALRPKKTQTGHFQHHCFSALSDYMKKVLLLLCGDS